MDRSEAREILANELAKYQTWSYDQLCAMIGAPKQTFELIGASGTPYSGDVIACWDGQSNGDVRVIACIDDGGWRAVLPLNESFIKARSDDPGGGARG